MATSVLPQQHHFVQRDVAIVCHQGQLVGLRLSNQHSVKWVPMMKRKLLVGQEMRQFNG
jgi:hypothetical protein